MIQNRQFLPGLIFILITNLSPKGGYLFVKRSGFLVIFAALLLFMLFTPMMGYAAYKEAAVGNGGSIKGKVSFKGPLPDDAVENITITKNTDVCGTGFREVVWVDVKGSALRGAFVFIDGITEGKAWTAPEGGKYMIEQKGCRFRPWAQVMRPGNITIRNTDNFVLHNINTREMIGFESGSSVKKVIFNFGQPDPGDIEKQLTPRRSPYISINCEAHNFMFGFLMAPPHPYAVVVGDDGAFEIGDVPAGDYKLIAWHPIIGLQETAISVPAAGAVEANFSFSAAQ